MNKPTKIPRYNVISLRISETERKQLDTLAERNKKCISSVMRDALEYYATHMTRDDFDY
jgi:predicted transcriptional regulator